MFPPGRGNDHLEAGDTYLISVLGTNEVLTAVGITVCLREYQEGHQGQMWICKVTSDHQIGMCNRKTEGFLGWGRGQPTANGSREQFTFTRLSLGGYSLKMSPEGEGEPRSLQRIDRDRLQLRTGKVCTQFGLHRTKNPVFRRFEWVIPGRLARSSAPHYDGEDADENINETSIEFLNNYGIKNIISLNSVELSPRQKSKLRKAKISYSHIKVVKCTAVTQDQFDQIWNFYDKAGVTIVYCGYGDGRVGMSISAIQLFQGRALDDNDYMENGVQCPS